ncbi:cAMP-dependent protein kinase regulatory subunit [Diplonema papillatum]|nr:cAMP-dependent protein kinase regulatory subunit [Diplonema papillatum]|eukprot:gene16943-25998_t
MSAVSLKGVYETKCDECDVKKNSAILEVLPAEGCAEDLRELDLSQNMVGLKGLVPVLEVVNKAPSITQLNLSDNQLSSQAAATVSQYLKGHKTLTSLNLAKNHLPFGGEPLVDYVKGSPALKALDLSETQIRPLFTKLIELQLKKNRGESVVSIAPPPADISATSNSVEQADSTNAGEDGGYNFGAFSFGGGGNEDVEEDNGNGDADADGDDDQQEVEDFDEEEEARQQAIRRAMAGDGARRKTVSSESISKKDMDSFQAKVIPKSSEDSLWLTAKLENVHLFSHLEDYELSIAVNAMEPVKFSKGALVVEEGEEGDKLFIICEGTAEESKDGKVTASLQSGDTMGETDLLYSAPHQTTVSVTSDTLSGYCLDRSTYRHIVTKSSHEKRARYMGFLQRVSFLKNMSNGELMQLADALKSATYKKGDVIIEHGSEGSWFHIITEGTVEVIGRKDGEKVQVCTFTEGECVGELEFINKHTCVADVLALTPDVRTAKMNRKHFERVMGPCVDVLKRVADTSDVFQYYRETMKNE